MFTVQWLVFGRMHYVRTEDYSTALILADALSNHYSRQIMVEIWDGATLKRRS